MLATCQLQVSIGWSGHDYNAVSLTYTEGSQQSRPIDPSMHNDFTIDKFATY